AAYTRPSICARLCTLLSSFARQLRGRRRDSVPPPSRAHRRTAQRRKTACHTQKRPYLARPQTEPPGAARREQREAHSGSFLRRSADCQPHIEAHCLCCHKFATERRDRAPRKSTAFGRYFVAMHVVAYGTQSGLSETSARLSAFGREADTPGRRE